jgi:RNA polymerase sigma factor (sigma-70 family)
MPQPPFADVLRYLRRTCGAQAARDLSDGELLKRFLADRQDPAFTVLVHRHSRMVQAVCQRVLGDVHAAEDAFQATFMVLVRRAASLRSQKPLGSWLHGVARRIALRARAQAAVRRDKERQFNPMPRPEPLDELTWQEMRAVLDEEIARLPEKFRAPIVLCYLEGRSNQQAAQELNCPKSTLACRVQQGRELLRQRLTQRGISLSAGLLVTVLGEKALGAPVGALLTIKTAKAAASVAAGKAVAGGCLSAQAIALAEEAVAGMIGIKGKLIVMLLVLGLGVGSAGLAGHGAFSEKEPSAKVERVQATPPKVETAKKDPPIATDLYGDPLPPGAVNRIGSVRFRHGGEVSRVLYTPDGKAIASTSKDGYLRLWDAASGKLRWRFEVGQDTRFQSIAASKDSQRLAVLTDNEFAILRVADGEKLVHHKWPKRGSDFGAIASDLTVFALSYRNDTVHLFDAATGAEKLHLSISEDKKPDRENCFAFSSNDRTIYVAAHDLPVVSVFDTATGKLLGNMEIDKGASVSELCVSPDSKLLAGLAATPVDEMFNQDSLILWDLTTKKWRRHVFDKGAMCVAFSPASSIVASGANDIRLFDLSTGRELRRMETQAPASIAFAPDGKTLACASNVGIITLWDVANGKLIAPTTEPSDGVFGLQFVAKGKRLLTLGSSVYRWDVQSGKPLWSLPRDPEWQYVPSVSPDGRLLAASLANEKGSLVLVDTSTGLPVRKLSGHTWWVWSTAFSQDGSKLFSSGGNDTRIIMWDVATGKSIREFQCQSEFRENITVSPNDRWLASWPAHPTHSRNNGDLDICLWDTATGELLHRMTPTEGSAAMVVFSADSSRLVSVGGELVYGIGKKPGHVQLWDVATGKEIRAFHGHKERVECVAMTADGRMLATGSDDKTLRLWEVASGAERCRISGHESVVRCLNFSPDGRHLAAASYDAPVYVWNAYALNNPQAAASKLSKEDWDKLWQQLAATDPAEAFQAVCNLIARPEEAVPSLQTGWNSPRATAPQIQQWLKDLDSNQFALRKNATAELERFGVNHEELLRKALQEAGSLEVRQRLEQIVRRLEPPRLRRTRMLEALEQIASVQARRFLQALAGQTENTDLSREATASLRRLEQR